MQKHAAFQLGDKVAEIKSWQQNAQIQPSTSLPPVDFACGKFGEVAPQQGFPKANEMSFGVRCEAVTEGACGTYEN